jgi:hypothetical protein
MESKMRSRSKAYQVMTRLFALVTLAVIAIATPVGASSSPSVSASDEAFLAAIHQVGIVAPDRQAVDVANQVARMADSGASNGSLRQVVQDFGVYDYHSDAFIAAAIAAYRPRAGTGE